MPTTYSGDEFSSLPSLRDARASFEVTGARTVLDGPICDLFAASKMQTKFGVALLHRHFDIKPDERLVDYHETATAWTAGDTTSIAFPKYGGMVVPRAYLFDASGDPRPYEFEFNPSNAHPLPTIDDPKDSEFFSAFHALLCSTGLEKILGLRTLDGYDPTMSVEVTEGRANIMLAPGAIPADSLIEAMWTFDTGPTTVRCHCSSFCFPDGNDHESNHGCS